MSAAPPRAPGRVLVLGGYGLIGSACMRALAGAGFEVTGMGRSAGAARTCDPAAHWVIRDIPTVTAAEWAALLAGVDVVVNAAGALQDGGRDDLEAIHVTAIRQMIAGAAGLPLRFVQISAAGAAVDAATPFLRSKARGDALIAAQAPDWVILRPTLVIAPEAYGGTALLRAASAMPGVLPRVLPQALVQTVSVADLAAAVVAAARGQVPSGTVADLTAAEVMRLPELAVAMRRWQGFPAPVWSPRVPDGALRLVGHLADGLGRLGWRSPLRSTALRTLRDGVRGDPAAWAAAGGAPCRGLAQVLAETPATRQDRAFARVSLALPLAIGVLAGFWLLSGLIALAQVTAAMGVLANTALPRWAVALMVTGGALADIALGALILWRPWARRAALGMVALSLAYLAGSLVTAPQLWLDPLGPMVKVLPGAALAAMVWLLLEDR